LVFYYYFRHTGSRSVHFKHHPQEVLEVAQQVLVVINQSIMEEVEEVVARDSDRRTR
jgi:hypothetical protein